ncbi:helicase-related protein [Halobacteriovorax sp. GB3]|uniref:helicase-related protein n=1 Tax=Halobacteriovorax sp. GB3 TaxID=2719615 RepID=UPI00236001CC|nr:helicase-related protein [Halobacteriovorax sp. GB3]MDD0854212.1 helicase-related protein [Halobacteriovorax sp. GB3]
MSNQTIPVLADFKDIRSLLETERKTIIKVNNFSDSDEYVRTIEDAGIVLDFIEEFQTHLFQLFSKAPSLANLFSTEYLSVHEFFKRDYILETIFLDDCLFPEKELYYFGQDGGLNEKILKIHLTGIERWCRDKLKHHENTQELILENFNLELKANELKCPCVKCSADFRARLRDFVFDTCKEVIETSYSSIENNIDNGIEFVSELYQKMQKELDKTFYKVRFKLKRSSLNRLEVQVKNILKEKFHYPSKLSVLHKRNLALYFDNQLEAMEFSNDLVTEEEYEKYFQTLANNFWRGEKYLKREFKKFIKSIVVLKKKDVSSKILQEYLGEFWVHSSARQLKRKIVYHMGPTNSGKTYHAIEALKGADKGCYLAPLRLLAGELYDTLNASGVKTSLLTGEEVIETEGATHYSSTIEMARFQEEFDCCVIDEIQMITDSQRGWAWTRALVNIFSPEIHVCGDPSALDLIKKIVELCGDELEIKNYTRMTELQVLKKPIALSEMQKSDALVVFSRRNALRYKRDLERLGFKVSIVYGRLSPEVRREQARKFDEGETDVIVSTDAISMGMNLPIKRIVFSTLSKFINSQEFVISDSEIKQIAGRAGRYKRFPTGYVSCLTKVEDGIDTVNKALGATLDQSTQCMVGPDLDIFNQVNRALEDNALPTLKLSEFLRLFNTMIFQKPFFCVELNEMIELAEMVEDADSDAKLTDAEIFGFSCAPVNQGLMEHVQYFVWILTHYVSESPITNEAIDSTSNDIDYLETSIKCVELYQWLSRHFNNKHFVFDENDLLHNKQEAIDKLNTLLSDKIVPTCSSCGCKLPEDSRFPICEECFKKRRFSGRRRTGNNQGRRGDDSKGENSGRSGKFKGRSRYGKPGEKSFGGKRKRPSRKRKTTK